MIFDRFKLRQVRNEKKMSQSLLAHKAETHQNYLSRMEKGGVYGCTNPSIHMLKRIATALGCEVEHLMSETVPTKKQQKYYKRNRRKKGEPLL